jgi:phosphoglycerate dehydrogenase-like enzyme
VAVTREVIDAAAELVLIQRPGAHLDAVDVAYALSKNLLVCNVPAPVSGSGTMVAEHIMFLMLALARRYREAQQVLARGEMGSPESHELRGKTLGLVGLGEIGQALVPMARGFGMQIWALRRTIRSGMREELGLDYLGTFSNLPHLLAESDFVSIHVPLASETRGLIGERELAQMKRGAFLINAARAAVLVKEAVVAALESGYLGGFGVDVFWEEPPNPKDALFAFPNVIATPHTAGTREGRLRIATIVAENVRRVRAGVEPMYRIT